MARDNSEAASLAFSNRSNILTLRRSKAMKGTSLSGFCTIVTHREGIAQVVYAYIGTPYGKKTHLGCKEGKFTRPKAHAASRS